MLPPLDWSQDRGPVSRSDHNWAPEWAPGGRWVRWGAYCNELIEPVLDCWMEQGHAQFRERTSRELARR